MLASTLMAFTFAEPAAMLAFHAVASPVDASSAAIRNRVCPPMVVKLPPVYTVLPKHLMTCTVPFELGFQLVRLLVERSKETMPVRAVPFTEVKEPPM